MHASDLSRFPLGPGAAAACTWAAAADPLVWHGPFKRPTLEAFAAALTTIAEGGAFGALPTLRVRGEDDQLVPLGPSRGGIDAVRGTDLSERIYPGGRHEVFNETNKDEVLDDVTSFIDRALTARARGVSES
ncbi:alpha/beta hydrolase [Nonomuraea dietziae]|uniref:alpha/beta hydrolase n=1 Tax=Nonomuraea dietziae TaxID=65515 RepID=UPI00342B4882